MEFAVVIPIFFFVILPIALLLLRSVVIWYTGANRRDDLLAEIVDQNRDIIALLEMINFGPKD